MKIFQLAVFRFHVSRFLSVRGVSLVDTKRSRCRFPGVGVCERLRCRWPWKERVVCFAAFSCLGSDERLMGEEGVWPGVGVAVGTGRGLGWERVLEPAGTPYLQLCDGQNTVCTLSVPRRRLHGVLLTGSCSMWGLSSPCGIDSVSYTHLTLPTIMVV